MAMFQFANGNLNDQRLLRSFQWGRPPNFAKGTIFPASRALDQRVIASQPYQLGGLTYPSKKYEFVNVVGMTSYMKWKIKAIWNHQPDMTIYDHSSHTYYIPIFLVKTRCIPWIFCFFGASHTTKKSARSAPSAAGPKLSSRRHRSQTRRPRPAQPQGPRSQMNSVQYSPLGKLT